MTCNHILLPCCYVQVTEILHIILYASAFLCEGINSTTHRLSYVVLVAFEGFKIFCSALSGLLNYYRANAVNIYRMIRSSSNILK